MKSMELKIRLYYMLIYAIIKLLKVINIKSHENCSWLFFCTKNKQCYMKNLKKQLFKQYYGEKMSKCVFHWI